MSLILIKECMNKMLRIAVDLTPIQPGGANGGAKIFVLQLLKNLAKLAPDYKFIIIATASNYTELSLLASDNIEIVQAPPVILDFTKNTRRHIFAKVVNLFINKCFPSSIGVRIKHALKMTAIRIQRSVEGDSFLKEKVDLLFCPFTAPFYHALKVPIVSIVYDLQSHYYPHFFTKAECLERRKFFEHACHKAEQLVCISDFVRQTVLDNSPIKPKKVKTIYISDSTHRLPQISSHQVTSLMATLQLKEQNYLLYPANFWQHKNHQMLITSFNMYRSQHPNSTLKLVFTGAASSHGAFLIDAIKAMGLSDWIISPGFVSDEIFSMLLTSSKALIFPSLYEGFGMPIIEAMSYGKPVLCSNIASLPEVAGNAAILFDPRRPTEIVGAIERLEHEIGLPEKLIALGKERAKLFHNEEHTAKQYLQVFHDTIKTKS